MHKIAMVLLKVFELRASKAPGGGAAEVLFPLRQFNFFFSL